MHVKCNKPFAILIVLFGCLFAMDVNAGVEGEEAITTSNIILPDDANKGGKEKDKSAENNTVSQEEAKGTEKSTQTSKEVIVDNKASVNQEKKKETESSILSFNVLFEVIYQFKFSDFLSFSFQKENNSYDLLDWL